MELSQLLAGSSTAASVPLGKGDGKASGNGDAEFARLYKQAGETNKRTAADTTVTTAIAGKASLAGNHLSAPLQDALPEAPEALDDSLVQAEHIPALPGELVPLTQQITQAIEGKLSENAKALEQQIGELASAQADTELASTQADAGLASAQAENGNSLAATLASLPAGAGELLADIRQRLDMIASAQRGDTLPTQQDTKLAFNAAQLITDAGDKLGSNDRAVALADSQTTGLRHQQLMAQSAQALTPQGATAQPTASPAGTFADAIAAVTSDEGAFLTRHGNDNPSSHSLNGTAAPLGATSSSVNGALPTTTQPNPGLTAPLASPQWQQGLGQQLVALHQRGGQQVELHLHPAELGPLSISLKVDDQLAQAQFFSANPQVRAAIEQAIPQLREALEESGIQLGEAMVGEQQQRDDGQEQKQGKGDLDGLANGILASAGDTALADQPSAVIGPDSNAIDLYA